jgi:hypothetical protein
LELYWRTSENPIQAKLEVHPHSAESSLHRASRGLAHAWDEVTVHVERQGDGIYELEQLGIIKVHGPYRTHVEPKGGAWLYVDADTLGYDLRADMLTVAESVARHEKAKPQDIDADTGLTPERTNIAALALEHEGNIHLIRFHGPSTYDFNEAWATPETRRYVRENRA